ncbi:hypothetical protein NQ816_18015, partial [Acinetobacter baumannii]|nr:hypothetical protein [Acinetobacter baumannii]
LNTSDFFVVNETLNLVCAWNGRQAAHYHYSFDENAISPRHWGAFFFDAASAAWKAALCCFI